MSENNQYKCGYCGFFIHSECGNLLEHQCFIDFFIEEDHDLATDDNNVLTVVMKNTGTKVSKTITPININSTDWEEHFISLVQERPALYNINLPLVQRTNAKKLQLWSQISNIFGGKISADELAKKWKYFRDCYMRAKKKVNEYKPSGSGAMPLPEPGFRHYYLMKFVEDGDSQQPTISSVVTTATSTTSQIPGTSGSSTAMPATPSSSPAMSSPNNLFSPTLKRKRKEEKKDLEVQILESFSSSKSQAMDGVDGFLMRIGESLRKMPYRERATLEINFMQLIYETEERLNN